MENQYHFDLNELDRITRKCLVGGSKSLKIRTGYIMKVLGTSTKIRTNWVTHDRVLAYVVVSGWSRYRIFSR